jgi:hypothetical protein
MIPINNSDTAWLIVSDYNQDNGLFYEELREDVFDPEISNWMFEYSNSHEGRYVGSEFIGGGSLVGFESIGFERSGGIIGDTQGQWVGGNY